MLLLVIGTSVAISLPAQAMLASAAKSASPNSKPTFAKDVAPILQANCQTCHRPGEAAPFSLLTYEQARPWAKAIKAAVLQKKMPPWYADPKVGKFANDRALSQTDIDTIVSWVDAGVPMGNPKDMPPPREFVQGWKIPKPDVVFQLPKPFQIPATGIMEYQYMIVPSGFTKDTWVEQVQAVPTNFAAVHHIVAYVRPPGSSYFIDMPMGEFFEAPPAKNDKYKSPKKDEPPTEWLTGYAPGQTPDIFKPGQAKLIPAGSDIVIEVHYMPSGKPTTDQARVGLVLAKQTPAERGMTLQTGTSAIKIPPGDPNYRLDSSYTIPEDVTLIGMHPHMHMRGKSAEYKIVFADGKTETLLNVPNYNWRWQLWYDLVEPIKLPKGTKVQCTEHFDNSRNNPDNPDPTKTVIWGQQSTDEMMVCMFNVVFDAKITTAQMLRPNRPKPAEAETKPAATGGPQQ